MNSKKIIILIYLISTMSMGSELCLIQYNSKTFSASIFEELQLKLKQSPRSLPSLVAVEFVSKKFKKVEEKYSSTVRSLSAKMSDSNISAKLEILKNLEETFQGLDKNATSIDRNSMSPKTTKMLNEIGSQIYHIKTQFDKLEPELRTAIDKSLEIRGQLRDMLAETQELISTLGELKDKLHLISWEDSSDASFIGNILEQKLTFLAQMEIGLITQEKNLKGQIHTGLARLEESYDYTRFRLVILEASGIQINSQFEKNQAVVKLGKVTESAENSSNLHLDGSQNHLAPTPLGQSLLSAFEKIPREQAIAMLKKSLFKIYQPEKVLNMKELVQLLDLAYPDNSTGILWSVSSPISELYNISYNSQKKGIQFVSEKTFFLLYGLSKLNHTLTDIQLDYAKELVVGDVESAINKIEEHKQNLIGWNKLSYFKKATTPKPKAFDGIKLEEIDKVVAELYIKRLYFENKFTSALKQIFSEKGDSLFFNNWLQEASAYMRK